MTLAEAGLILRSRLCRCGAGKRERCALCLACYRRLPPPKRRALFRRFSQGFPEAYADAVRYLDGGARVR